MVDVVSIHSSSQLAGHFKTPGDKSISHRAVLLGALGEGISTITGISGGEDVARTLRIVEQLGASVDRSADQPIRIGGGRHRLSAADEPLDCGNSGTTMRLVMGLVSGLKGTHHLIGDASLSRRPMDRVATPLREMGALVEGRGEQVLPPLTVTGAPLHGLTYDIPVPSAQVKSALLLAGLFADSAVSLREVSPTRPNTEEMLALCGVALERNPSNPLEMTLHPGLVQPHDWSIPGDPSQAAFFLVAALLAESGEVGCTSLYGDVTRIGYLKVLDRMGARLILSTDDNGSLAVTALSSQLRATEIDAREIPSVDEVPILAIAAAAAEGTTRFRDVGELRIKESDRFATSLALVQGLGAQAWGEGDDLVIEGLGSARQFSPLEIDAHGDHRVAMAAAIGGVVGNGADISGFDAVATSYPDFLEQLEGLR